MTKRLDHAIAVIRKLPSARQDEAAQLLLDVANWEPESVNLSTEQAAEVQRRLDVPEASVPHTDVRARFLPTDA